MIIFLRRVSYENAWLNGLVVGLLMAFFSTTTLTLQKDMSVSCQECFVLLVGINKDLELLHTMLQKCSAGVDSESSESSGRGYNGTQDNDGLTCEQRLSSIKECLANIQNVVSQDDCSPQLFSIRQMSVQVMQLMMNYIACLQENWRDQSSVSRNNVYVLTESVQEWLGTYEVIIPVAINDMVSAIRQELVAVVAQSNMYVPLIIRQVETLQALRDEIVQDLASLKINVVAQQEESMVAKVNAFKKDGNAFLVDRFLALHAAMDNFSSDNDVVSKNNNKTKEKITTFFTQINDRLSVQRVATQERFVSLFDDLDTSLSDSTFNFLLPNGQNKLVKDNCASPCGSEACATDGWAISCASASKLLDDTVLKLCGDQRIFFQQESALVCDAINDLAAQGKLHCQNTLRAIGQDNEVVLQLTPLIQDKLVTAFSHNSALQVIDKNKVIECCDDLRAALINQVSLMNDFLAVRVSEHFDECAKVLNATDNQIVQSLETCSNHVLQTFVCANNVLCKQIDKATNTIGYAMATGSNVFQTTSGKNIVAACALLQKVLACNFVATATSISDQQCLLTAQLNDLCQKVFNAQCAILKKIGQVSNDYNGLIERTLYNIEESQSLKMDMINKLNANLQLMLMQLARLFSADYAEQKNDFNLLQPN